MDYTIEIKSYLALEIEILKKIDIEALNQCINLLEDSRKRNSNVYIFGNGGSATTASHFVCDFNKGISDGLSDKYNFICLNDNVPSLLAIANDMDYSEIFKYQLISKLKPDDVVIGISGSGNSKNIVKALTYAKEIGAITIGLTGYDGGRVKKIADYSLHVPIDNMQITEDIHMIFDHLMMFIIKKNVEIYGE